MRAKRHVSGLRCTKCLSREFEIVQTKKRNGFIWRKRRCLKCKMPCFTEEREKLQSVMT